MQVGETVQVSYTDVQAAPFSVTGGSLVVTLPNGTNNNLSISATSQNTPATTHTVTATLAAPQAGTYNLSWTFTDGTYTWIRQQTRFAFVNNVPFMVRDRLRRTVTLLPDPVIEYVFNTMQRQIYASYASVGLPAYGSFNTYDQACFDEGVAILAALRLRRYTPVTTPSGELSSFKVQQIEYKFVESAIKSAAGFMSNLTPDEQWFRDGYQLLEQVSVINSLYATQTAGFSTWRIAGPSRSRLANGQQSMFGVMASLLSDNFDYNTDALSFNSYLNFMGDV